MPLRVQVRSIKGRPGPARALEMSVMLGWTALEPGFLLWLDGRLSFCSRVVSDNVILAAAHWRGLTPIAVLRKGEEYVAALHVPLASNALRFIEERRGTNDLGLSLELRFHWQEVLDEQGEGTEWTASAGRVWAGSAGAEIMPIARSDWLRLLQEMEWDEFELFELRRLPLLEDRNLAEALKLLRQAQAYLREGGYGEVLSKCRLAFESAAKYEIAGDDLKKGFAQLLTRAFGETSPKIREVDKIIGSLSDYVHLLGRHAQYPTISVDREEAEFGYACTLALFSLLSRRLARERLGT